MDSLILEPTIQLTQIASNCHLDDLDSSPFMGIGVYSSNDIYRILLKFSINKLPENAEIVSANLKLNLIVENCKQINIITPFALTKSFTLSTVTWNNQPTFNPKIIGESLNVKKDFQYEFNITPIVQKWYVNKIPNHGIILKSQETNNSSFVKAVTDKNRSSGPKLEIYYKLKCPCRPTSTKFVNKVDEFDTNDLYNFSRIRNTSLTTTVIFFIKNFTTHEITAHLQVSPNGFNFINEPTKISVGINRIKFIVPCIFAKFTRVAVKNLHCGERSRVKIWYQAQE